MGTLLFGENKGVLNRANVQNLHVLVVPGRVASLL